MSGSVQNETVHLSDSARGAGPSAIHIVVVVYGRQFCDLLSEITLPNLAALVPEIDTDLRSKSVVRILTRVQDIPIIEASPVLPTLRKNIAVEIVDALEMAGFGQYGDYGPMVMTQRNAVMDAARANAALFFVGPDQIYSRGSFGHFIDRLRQGYRIIVGPSPRIRRNAVRAFLKGKITGSSDGAFALSPQEQIDLFFRYYHPINDQFMLDSPEGIFWKAYIHYRPHSDEFFLRFIQGPTLVAWPRGPLAQFHGFIDHDLILNCCRDWREAYVIPDAAESLALDLTDEGRQDRQRMAHFPRADLLHELSDSRAIKDMQIVYAFRTCRIYRGAPNLKQLAWHERAFTRAIDPLLWAALIERKLRQKLGRCAALPFRGLCRLNANTLCLILGGLVAGVTRFKKPLPLSESA